MPLNTRRQVGVKKRRWLTHSGSRVVVRKSCWKGSNWRRFGSVCRFSAAASKDKVAQTKKMTSNKKENQFPVYTQKSKAEFSVFQMFRFQ